MNPKDADEIKKSTAVLGLFDAAIAATIKATQTGEINQFIGSVTPMLEGKGGGRLEGWFREHGVGRQTPNQQAVTGFFSKVRAEDFFANGGKNLTANEIAQVGPYWPKVDQDPKDFLRNLMITYYATVLNRFKANKGFGPQDELPIDLLLDAIQKDIDKNMLSIEKGTYKPNDIKAFKLFDTTLRNYAKEKEDTVEFSDKGKVDILDFGGGIRIRRKR
jgi:hypothetical protein